MTRRWHLVHGRSCSLRLTDQLFDRWVAEHSPLLYRLAYWWTGSRTEAEDLTQEALFQSYRSRESLRDPGAAKAWLVKTLRFCFTRELRRQRGAAFTPLEDAHELRSAEPVTPELIAVRQAVESLDEHYRAVVVLFYFEELSYRDIADILDLPIGTVMSRLARGRKILHDVLRPKPRTAEVKEIRRA